MTDGPDDTTPLSRREIRARESQETASLPTTALGEPSETPAFHEERRIRPLPVALAAAGGVLVIVATLVIVGIAGNHGTPVPVASTSAPPAAAVTGTPTSPTPSATAEAPRRAAGPNECVDAVGEGGAVDIDSASVALQKGDLVARFQLVSALPDGAASLGIFAESRDGKRSYQLAASWQGGELDTFLVHDFQRDRDTKLDPRDIHWDDTTVTAAFPDDILRTLGDGWRWYAFSTADGKDADACPGDPLTFDTLTFDDNAGKGDN